MRVIAPGQRPKNMTSRCFGAPSDKADVDLMKKKLSQVSCVVIEADDGGGGALKAGSY